jgi:putative SOS response-associated peptidase YedK
MSQLHDRMPVVLAQETVDQWLDGDDKVLSKVAEHSPALRAWPVDRRVNNARNEGEDLIKSTGTSLSA